MGRVTSFHNVGFHHRVAHPCKGITAVLLTCPVCVVCSALCRSVALLHPLVMGILFAATGWAGWLGWQWRRTRTIGDDIKALKAQLPKPAADGEAPAAPAALTAQISGLEKVGVQNMAAPADRLGIQFKWV